MHGILLQLPLPDHLDDDEMTALIDPAKDVDGLTPIERRPAACRAATRLVPCTPAGVMELLAHAGVELEGARAVVVGRSQLVGKPLAQLLLAANADRHPLPLAHARPGRRVPASRRDRGRGGRRDLVTADMVGEGAVVIDVGTNRTDEGSWRATSTSRRSARSRARSRPCRAASGR